MFISNLALKSQLSLFRRDFIGHRQQLVATWLLNVATDTGPTYTTSWVNPGALPSDFPGAAAVSDLSSDIMSLEFAT